MLELKVACYILISLFCLILGHSLLHLITQFVSWVSAPEMKGETTWFAKAAPGTPESAKFLWLFITLMPTGVRMEINSIAN